MREEQRALCAPSHLHFSPRGTASESHEVPLRVGSIVHSVLYIWTVAPGDVIGKPLVVLFG